MDVAPEFVAKQCLRCLHMLQADSLKFYKRQTTLLSSHTQVIVWKMERFIEREIKFLLRVTIILDIVIYKSSHSRRFSICKSIFIFPFHLSFIILQTDYYNILIDTAVHNDMTDKID